MPQFKTLNYLIDDQALTLSSADGTSLNIRPKTCQLLIALISKPGETVSKEDLLDTVWEESVVDEQVVFQSIREIRKLFPDKEVIKTVPKKGYIWIPDVTQVVIPLSNVKRHRPVRSDKLYALGISVVIVGFLAFLFFGQSQQNYKSPNSPQSTQRNSEVVKGDELLDGSIVILPADNRVMGNDHSWVRLGLMDQLIQRLPSTDSYGVLQTDYVLQVLERANAPLSQVSEEHIPSIFDVSGAELIVATRLSGSPHDYRLSYTLYRRQSQQKGVIFERNIQSAIDELSLVLASKLGNEQPLSAHQYHADFNDEMLGVAIDLQLESKYEQAMPLLESIVMGSPDNLTAQRLLIETYLQIGLLDKAKAQLDQAIPIAEARQDANELARLIYFRSIYLFMNKDIQSIPSVLDDGIEVAREAKDWLFLAYLTELKATYAEHHERFDEAERFYHEALSYHQVLKCPLGETQTWLALGVLAAKQEDTQKREMAFDKAFEIASKRSLIAQLAQIEEARGNH